MLFAAGVERHRLLTDMDKSGPPRWVLCSETGRERLRRGEPLPARPSIMSVYNTGSMRA